MSQLRLKPRGTSEAWPKASRPKARRKVLIIGIAGCSGCGKSTLAKTLAKDLASPVTPVSLDWYLRPKWMPKVHGGRNWETPEGIDWKSLRSHLQTALETFSQAETVPEELNLGPNDENVIQKGQAGRHLDASTVVLVVEGFLLFYDDQIAEMLHIKIWIDAGLQTCMERRHKRGKASRKQDVENSKLWFRDSIWSHYLRYKQKQLSNAVGALRVDGEVSKEEILSQCLPYCTKMVSARVQVVLRSRKEAASANSTNGANGRKICDRENGRSAPQKRPQEDNYESRGCSRRYR